MKVIAQVCVLFAIVAVVYSASSTWGVHNVTDTLVINKRVFYPAARNIVQTIYFDIPESVSYIRNYLTPAAGLVIVFIVIAAIFETVQINQLF